MANSPNRNVKFTNVLAAQSEAIRLTKAGVKFDAPHNAVVRVLTQGLLDLGILDNKVGGLGGRDCAESLSTVFHAPHGGIGLVWTCTIVVHTALVKSPIQTMRANNYRTGACWKSEWR